MVKYRVALVPAAAHGTLSSSTDITEKQLVKLLTIALVNYKHTFDNCRFVTGEDSKLFAHLHNSATNSSRDPYARPLSFENVRNREAKRCVK